MFRELLKMAVESKIEGIIAEREYIEKTKEQRRRSEIEDNNRKQREELEKQAQEAEERNKRRERLIQNIDNQMESWHKSRKLLKFAEELEAYTSNICDQTKKQLLDKYISLVRDKANACDSIANILNEVKNILP
jgi:flagellar motility protein MotE (MotC chaperone)